MNVDTEVLSGLRLSEFDKKRSIPLSNFLGHMEEPFKPQADFISITDYFDQAIIDTLLLKTFIRFFRTCFMRSFPYAF